MKVETDSLDMFTGSMSWPKKMLKYQYMIFWCRNDRNNPLFDTEVLLSKVNPCRFLITLDQITSVYAVRGTGLHQCADWVSPPVDVKAIFGSKVCSMIIQGKWYLWLQMSVICCLEMEPAANFPTFSFPIWAHCHSHRTGYL